MLMKVGVNLGWLRPAHDANLSWERYIYLHGDSTAHWLAATACLEHWREIDRT